jgi:TolB-like protein/DNA-binding winged helix-turn-helix (wHTH) protein
VTSDFRVGPWLVAPSLNTVSLNGTSIRLEPKVMEVLVCLARRSGQPLAKEQLLRTVWPGTFVSDDVLIRSISELRRVFEDDAKDPRFIQTIPKRGYRLVQPIVWVNGTEINHSLEAPAVEVGSAGIHIPARLGRALAVFLVLAGGFAAWEVHHVLQVLPRKNAGSIISSLAVLPLQNLSGDPSQEYFADAMTEELITELSRVSALNVISRTSVMPYKGSKKSLPEIARELHADAIVEGSILRSGDRVRVTAQLIYADKDTNVWAETYDRDLEDVLGLQSAVARAIANEIRVQVKPQESMRLRAVRPVNRKALDAYLEGKRHLEKADALEFHKGMGEAFDREIRQAVSSFQQATREDPNYVPAHLAIFDAVGSPGLVAHPELIPDARQALKRALDLDDTLAEGHLRMARLKMQWDWDYAAAGREYERALEISPNSADVHSDYADYLEQIGRADDANGERERAQELDPTHNRFVNLFPTDWNLDQAREFLDKEDPNNGFSRAALGKSYQILGLYREAVVQYIKSADSYGYHDEADVMRRQYARGEYKRAIRDWMAIWEKRAQHEYIPAFWPAFLYANLGDKEAAFRWLQRAFEQHSWCMLYLNEDMVWDPVRDDPRFRELVRRVGLPEDHGQFQRLREQSVIRQ